MYFKEWLRVRKALIGFTICIAATALLIFALSGSFISGTHTSNQNASAGIRAATSGQSHVKTHAAQSQNVDTVNIKAPGIAVHNADNTSVSMIVALAALASAIFATILGMCLAMENDGHLEIAWTRPASRVAYAARVMSVDVAGIVAAFVITLLIAAGLIYACGWEHYLHVDQEVWMTSARLVTYPLAWFGLIVGLTASMRSMPGLVAGGAWGVAMAFQALPEHRLPPMIQGLVQAVNFINPLMYGSYVSGLREQGLVTSAVGLAGLVGIALAGAAAALVQWRRLEA